MKNDSPTARAVLADPSSIDTVEESAAQHARESAARFGGWHEDDTFDPYVDEPEVEPRAPDTIPAPPPAEARVVEECRKVVHSLARRAARMAGVDEDDLVQEAWLAVLEQVPDFDPTRGASLATFVFLAVRRHVRRAVRRELRRGLVAKHSGSRGALVKIALNVTASFDAPVDVAGATLHDRIGVAEAREDAIDSARNAEKLARAIAALPERDREVLAMRDRGMPHEEIGRVLGLTTGRVDQLVPEIGERIRTFLETGHMPAPREYRKRWLVDGREVSIAEASRMSGVPYSTLKVRVRDLGWSVKDAMTTPVGRPGRRPSAGRAA